MKKYKYKKSFTFEGKRYYIYANTLEEAGIKKANKLADLKLQRNKESDISVREWTEKCVEIYRPNQSEETKKKERRRINTCILSYIGDMRLKDITPLHCQEVLNKQNGNSKSQINKVYGTLRLIFSHAVYNDLIQKDPTLLLKKPKGTYTPRRSLTPFERDVFLKIATTDKIYFAFLLMLYCGCRPLEACECKGSDIFFIGNQPMLHIRGTKTRNADRNVPIPDELYQIIKDTPPHAYIGNHKGKKITPTHRQWFWHKLWRNMNILAGTKVYRNGLVEPYMIPKDLHPYCLRHEFCSDLARRGIDIRVAQKLMGHSNIAMTANIYTHVDNSDIIKALNPSQK